MLPTQPATRARRRAGAPAGDAGATRLVVLVVAAVLLVVGGTTAGVLAAGSSRTRTVHQAAGHSAPSLPPAPTPTLAIAGVSAGAGSSRATVSWRQPLSLQVTDGTLTSVTASGPQGAVAGTLTATGWTGTGSLLPSSTYTVHADVRDTAGASHPLVRTLVTTAPEHLLTFSLSPGTGSVVGVGQPIVLQLDRSVQGRAARAALLAHLRVTTVPAAQGAWHYYNAYEVHYRPRTYWQPGTKVTVVADLRTFHLPGTGTWGSTSTSTRVFSIGDSLISTVDITAHTMSVRRNGQLLRTLPVSTGRDKYPTKGGVHIVLSVEREQLYDSSTVGIPTAGPDGYYEKLPYSMRISNAGAFVHANPATVKYQGRLNVSHGCVNLSLADAKWFYEQSHRGDIVDVVHAVIPPVLWDAGMADWNLSWADWSAGNLG